MLTLKYLRYWHTRFNTLVFDGKLSRAVIVIEPLGDKFAGFCATGAPCTISIDSELTRQQARIIMLHEMVHQWQSESGLPMDHGRSFSQWRTQCKLLTGLPLSL